MGSVLVGLIFLVGLVVVVGFILSTVFKIADAGKRAVTGNSRQRQPVRGEWRGLPIPVDAEKLKDVSDVPSDPPPPPGYHVAFMMPGAYLPAVAQWFHDAWTQAGYIKESATKSATESALLTVRDPNSEGTIVAAFQQRHSPHYLVAVVLSDLRVAE